MNRLIIIILLIAFCTVGYFAFTVFTKRENDLMTDKSTTLPPTEKSNTHTQKNTDTNSGQKSDTSNGTMEESNAATDDPTEERSFYVNVTSTDCARACAPYKYNDKELRYCQNVCGISESTSSDDCDRLKDLDKDYCYKDQAIEKKDTSICDNISDTAIKKTCKNRIQEEIIEKM